VPAGAVIAQVARVVDEAGSTIVRAPAHVDLTVVGAFSGHDRSFRRAPAF